MSEQGYIYLCRNHRNGYTKIGYSKTPSHREKTLQSEEPEVSFIATFPGTHQEERMLHERYQNKRLRGEWFDLSEENVAAILAVYAPEAGNEWEQFYLTWHDTDDVCIDGGALQLWEPSPEF